MLLTILLQRVSPSSASSQHIPGLAVHKELILGIVYNPVLDEMFTATKGGGAYLNSSPIQVSTTSELNKALVATEVGVERDATVHSAVMERFN